MENRILWLCYSFNEMQYHRISQFFRLCLVPGKSGRKCEEKKTERKNRKKEKVKKNKKLI